LLARARDVGVDVREETQAANLIIENDLVRGVEMRSGNGRTQSCRAQIVIDATGRTRGLCRQLENRISGRKNKRAELVAFKAHLTGTSEIRNACEIYFYKGGYGGLSGVEGGASNLCFIVAAQAVREKGSAPERVMHEIVAANKRAGETLKNARVESAWLSVALENFGRQEPSLLPGLIAIGDAASFIDPFTGSGMLMALESGSLAAEVIAAELSSGAQLNLLRVQSIYQQRYDTRFAARLRFCAILRRLAFAPRAIAEVAACVLGANEHIERSLARATRRASSSA
jgi:flavin-dependent dehydrogenase